MNRRLLVAGAVAASLAVPLTAQADERIRFGRNGIYDVTVYRNDRPDDVVLEFRGRSRTIGR